MTEQEAMDILENGLKIKRLRDIDFPKRFYNKEFILKFITQRGWYISIDELDWLGILDYDIALANEMTLIGFNVGYTDRDDYIAHKYGNYLHYTVCNKLDTMLRLLK